MDEFSSLETVLKEIVSKTHKEGEPVEDLVTTVPDELAASQLLWHIDISWGIDGINKNTVKWVETRTKQSVSKFGDKYLVISAQHDGDVDDRLQVFEFSDDSPLRSTVQKLRNMKLKVTTGRWIIPGRPLGVVVDIDSASWAYDRYKNELQIKQGIVVPDDTKSRNVLLFGYMVAQFLAEYKLELDCSSRLRHRHSKMVANFHGVVTLVGLILLRDWRVPSATVFISHDPDSTPESTLTPEVRTERIIPSLYRGLLQTADEPKP